MAVLLDKDRVGFVSHDVCGSFTDALRESQCLWADHAKFGILISNFEFRHSHWLFDQGAEVVGQFDVEWLYAEGVG